MSNIIKLKETSFDDIRLVKRSLMNLRKCYPQFSEWYDSKILPNLNNDARRIFLATNNGEFSGALILKRTDEEKKVCTLFVNEKNRHKNLGLDFLRIASEELETYKLPITISDEAKSYFFNSNSFNFQTKDVKESLYTENMKEYIGYILYHDEDKCLKNKYC